MPQPSQRKLWCAFSDNPDRVFSLSCTLGVDTIDDLKKMIWERNHWELDLYSVVSVVNMKDSLVQLHPRQQILSDFPPSKDTGIDILVVRPESTATGGKIPHLELLCYSHR